MLGPCFGSGGGGGGVTAQGPIGFKLDLYGVVKTVPERANTKDRMLMTGIETRVK
jgi:hypothetical protein